MNRFYQIILLFSIALMMSACTEQDSNLSAIKFGTITQYNPAFGSNAFNEILEVPIQLEFNDFAVEQNSYVELEWVNDKGGNFRNAVYYVNGTKMLDNKVKLLAKNYRGKKKIRLGLQFKEGTPEGRYNGYLKIKKSDLDRIDNVDIASNSNAELYRWQARFRKTWHPIVKGVAALLAFLIALHLLWFLIARPFFYPKFGRGEFEMLEPDYRKIKLKGYRRIHLGNKEKIKQGFLSKFYTGKIGQILNEYDFNVEITPFRRRGNIWCRIKADPDVDVEPVRKGTLYNFDEVVIRTAAKEKIMLVYKNSKNNRRA